MQGWTNHPATKMPEAGQQMADADYDDFGYLPLEALRPVQGVSSWRIWVNVTGAVMSLGLLVGFAVWSYQLAALEVTGVPVVRAIEGPMRILPKEPGGDIMQFQGLAVNDVAAEGVAAELPDRLTLAPRPVDLADEDQPGLAAGAGGAPSVSEAVAFPAGGLAQEGADLALAAKPVTESASPTTAAVDAALAEALGLEAEPTDPDLDAPALETAAAPAVDPLPLGAILTSPRPKPRPDLAATDPATDAAMNPLAETETILPPVREVDPATIPLGTRLVQFGTYDSTEKARAAWAERAGRFGDLMADKAMVLQPAESNGRSFWRLRAHGFADEAEARRFCVAFTTEELICIPVPQR